ncbi:unnamed protein product [Clavelina lepadiformis]|uniref:Uncharacterized protein n=1 Tax=Clavelina lepadiformis TaxID=159417 RepID=A0ABP0FWZ6_CLALP
MAKSRARRIKTKCKPQPGKQPAWNGRIWSGSFSRVEILQNAISSRTTAIPFRVMIAVVDPLSVTGRSSEAFPATDVIDGAMFPNKEVMAQLFSMKDRGSMSSSPNMLVGTTLPKETASESSGDRFGIIKRLYCRTTRRTTRVGKLLTRRKLVDNEQVAQLINTKREKESESTAYNSVFESLTSTAYFTANQAGFEL